MAEETKKVEETKKDNITKVKVKKPEDNITRVNIDKPLAEEKKQENVKQEEDIIVVNEEPKKEEQVEEVSKDEKTIVQEITEEQVQEVEQEVEQAIVEAEQTGKPLPEKIEKLISFMEETGGDLVDYVNLNRDIKNMDDADVLDEYYRTTKSHLSPEERNFILEERFNYDVEVDDEKDIKRKKIALKEQVAEAKAYLDRQKSKYYENIKAGNKLTSEQKKAIDFFNRYNKDSEKQKKLTESSKRTFLNKTKTLFNEDFKGFDYKVGDKKFRFNVKDVDKVRETQSDINNFINRFVDEDKTTISDAAGYHKSLYTAMNADNIAKHFYEQGKADAIKEKIAKDKNIDLTPRQTHGETNVGGVKYKVLGQSTSEIKNRSFKIRKRK
mgnify:CR=1 FL=1|tara:strand:+ start:3507 stop:4655 length:1149 start_codon:yes stop_codon:yes gene_type:complete